jgi:hypothetical protein
MDPNIILIHPTGVVDTFPPLYSLSISTDSKPNVVFYGGPHSPSTIIGTAVFHSLSGKIDLNLHGQSIIMKPEGMPLAYHFEFPPVGKLKWQAGAGLELRDAGEMKVVKLKSSGLLSEERVFEMMLPCEPRFVDLVVLSGWAIRADMDREQPPKAGKCSVGGCL